MRKKLARHTLVREKLAWYICGCRMHARGTDMRKDHIYGMHAWYMRAKHILKVGTGQLLEEKVQRGELEELSTDMSHRSSFHVHTFSYPFYV